MAVGDDVLGYLRQRVGQPLLRLIGEQFLLTAGRDERGQITATRQHQANLNLGTQGPGHPNAQSQCVRPTGRGQIGNHQPHEPTTADHAPRRRGAAKSILSRRGMAWGASAELHALSPNLVTRMVFRGPSRSTARIRPPIPARPDSGPSPAAHRQRHTRRRWGGPCARASRNMAHMRVPAVEDEGVKTFAVGHIAIGDDVTVQATGVFIHPRST